ncbi:dipeptide ABC transporter ATP-binding protein [Boudabousia liubingyangii]|uniref:dipeptide ABC transporter ATP-binding protein n=1 Tax=Boudabousia liubingyangii TaxID=1921764 RepID=UPI0009F927A1|nr:ABC transporter ATP-binding protein [Boudabousia liubingyangii]
MDNQNELENGQLTEAARDRIAASAPPRTRVRDAAEEAVAETQPRSLPEHTILLAQDISVRFPGSAQAAVKDADLEIKHGEVTALVGESGSGKSVTARAIMGLLGKRVEVGGSAVLSGRKDNPNLQLIGAGSQIMREVRGARIAMVFQEPTTAMNPLMTIGDQIDEVMLIHKDADRKEARERSLELLGEVGLQDPQRVYRSYPHQVSGGQLQRACIAMAIACRPCVVIADEPTTALDMLAQKQILDLLRRLCRERRIGILLITHDMGVVADLADRVIVLRRGQVEEAGPVEQVFYHPQAPYTQKLLASVPRLGHTLQAQVSDGEVSDEEARASVNALLDPVLPEPKLKRKGADEQPLAVEVKNLSVVYPGGTKALSDVSFDLPAGEILALVGQSGSGKSTLGATIYGQVKATEGEVRLAGEKVSALRGGARRRALARVGVVFQNPAASLNPRRTVIESVAEPLRTHTKLSAAERRERALHALKAARFDPQLAYRYPHELSGGQRQRVAIARAIVLRPTLVIADEPTSALDVSVQAQVLATLADLQERMGFACLLITHDLAVVEQLASRTIVLKSGEVMEAGSTKQILQDPQTKYTQDLINAVPVADPREQAARREAAAAGKVATVGESVAPSAE